MNIERVLLIEMNEIFEEGVAHLVNIPDLLTNTLSIGKHSQFWSQRSHEENTFAKELSEIVSSDLFRFEEFSDFHVSLLVVGFFAVRDDQGDVIVKERIVVFDEDHRLNVLSIQVALTADHKGEQMNVGHVIADTFVDRRFDLLVGQALRFSLHPVEHSRRVDDVETKDALIIDVARGHRMNGHLLRFRMKPSVGWNIAGILQDSGDRCLSRSSLSHQEKIVGRCATERIFVLLVTPVRHIAEHFIEVRENIAFVDPILPF